MCPHHMLYHNVAVNKVGAYPRRVEGGVCTVQERNAHNIIANVTFLVYLCVYVCVCVCVCVCVFKTSGM